MLECHIEPNIVGQYEWDGLGRASKGILVSQSSVKEPYLVGSSKDFSIYPQCI